MAADMFRRRAHSSSMGGKILLAWIGSGGSDRTAVQGTMEACLGFDVTTSLTALSSCYLCGVS